MISTYDELVTAVKSWLRREELETQVPDFITLAEAHFNRVIRTVEMETRSQVSAASEFIALPADFLAIREIHIEASVDKPINYHTPQNLAKLQLEQRTGRPIAYTILDGQIKLYPAPSAEAIYDLEMIYLQKIPALSTSNQTNWLLTDHPDIYLHCALTQAEAFVFNDKRVPIWERKCSMGIAELNDIANQKRLGAGPMIPRVENVV